MSVKDFIKKSVLENFSPYNVPQMAAALLAAVLLGALIYWVYQRFYAGVLFSRSFAMTLVGMSVLTCMVTLAISSNVVISLGMVGALSIVRFRAAIKEPVEIVFLFWSLAVGIVIGAGMIPLAVIGSAIIGLILLLFANRKVRHNPYILVLSCADEGAETAALELLGRNTAHWQVKSKTVTASGIELTAELRARDASTAFVNEISRLPGVGNAILVSYNGEYLS